MLRILLAIALLSTADWEEDMASRPVAERRADDQWSRMAISGLLCFYAGEREAALREISLEQHYGRIGGYVNKVKIYELQQRVREADEKRAVWIPRLPAGPKGKPMKCTGRVAEIAECVGLELAGDPCADHIMQAFVETVSE